MTTIVGKASIVATETYTTFRYVIPANLIWIWRKYVTGDIKTIPIQVTLDNVTKVAYLNIHGTKKSKTSVLVVHGDYGHPFSMLHTIDIAQNRGHSTFSLYIPGVDNNKLFGLHDEIVKEAINRIQKENGGTVLGVGHSKGATLLAHRQFVVGDWRIKATCSIAGRLNAPQEKDCRDRVLRPIVQSIYSGAQIHSHRPIVQIVPKEDWMLSYGSMVVRPHNHCYTVPGKHLSGMYTFETRKHFTDFLINNS